MLGSLLGAWAYLLRWPGVMPLWKGQVNLFRMAAHQSNSPKDGLILKVLERNQGQKWLGCILTACGSMMQHMDLPYHMEEGTETMHANRWILQDKTTSIYMRLS